MDAESFTDLALRVISREATEDERRTLETELSASPSQRAEFEQLKITHDILRTTAPMSEATHAQEPALPAWRVNELRTAVRQHFGPAKATTSASFFPSLRWIFSGGAVAVLGVIVVFISLADRSVEVGLYGTDLVRGDSTALNPGDIPSARIVTFDQDAPFDEWQTQPLAWFEHAKVWVDNEHDLLHIVRRDKNGHNVVEKQPLASSSQGQRDQIKQVVESLEKH